MNKERNLIGDDLIDYILQIEDIVKFKETIRKHRSKEPVGFCGTIIDRLDEKDPRRHEAMRILVEKYI